MTVPLAKITPPLLQHAVARKRLFVRLDGASKHPLVWVSAPAGSGKTTLVASWLRARQRSSLWYQMDAGDADAATFFHYLASAAQRRFPRGQPALPRLSQEPQVLSIFAHSFFAALQARSNRAITLVLDNYQDLPSDAPLHAVLRDALSCWPRGSTAIVASRAAPPPVFAALRAADQVAFVDEIDLRFTLEESRALLGARDVCSGSRSKPRRLPLSRMVRLAHDKARGWAAGMVLLSESARLDSAEPELAATPEKVFDYFEEKLFARLRAEDRDLLLRTALLREVSPAIATRLTGGAAAQILSNLNRTGFFTERRTGPGGPVYQYHPLFREFLLARAHAELRPARLRALRARAARMLAESAHHEDAAGLFVEARDWPGLSRLIVSQARALVAQGRRQTLAGWIGALPEAVVRGHHWLLYWRATCRLHGNPSRANADYERAHALFVRAKDREGILLSIVGVVTSLLQSFGDYTLLDRWIATLEEHLSDYPLLFRGGLDDHVAFCMFVALMFRQPQHPDLPVWLERVRDMMRRSEDPNLRARAASFVSYYYWWIGDLGEASTALDEVRLVLATPSVSPIARVGCALAAAGCALSMARFDECVRIVEDALRLARATGLHHHDNKLLGYLVTGSLAQGDLPRAAHWLERAAEATRFDHPRDASLFRGLAGAVDLARGQHASAVAHRLAALTESVRTGMPFSQIQARIGLAQALYSAGDPRGAGRHLAVAHRLAAASRSASSEFRCLLTEAHFALSSGRAPRGRKTLRRATALGSSLNCLEIGGLLPEDAAALCAEALRSGIEPEYVRTLVRSHRLTPRDPPLDVPGWPFPVRLRTLGGFRVEIDGLPVEFQGKVQQKPLGLAKLLVASGGRGVSQERLARALWPEAADDQARASLDTTLHRLRTLLEDKAAARLSDGRVSLDPRTCWVDAWAFEDVCARLDLAGKGSPTHSPVGLRLATEAMALYHGPFLRGERGGREVEALRERLRDRFVRVAVAVADHWEASGEIEKCLASLLDALGADETAEELHHRVIACYAQLGRHTEAVAAYERCRDALAAGMQAEPSPATEALRRSLGDRVDVVQRGAPPRGRSNARPRHSS